MRGSEYGCAGVSMDAWECGSAQAGSVATKRIRYLAHANYTVACCRCGSECSSHASQPIASVRLRVQMRESSGKGLLLDQRASCLHLGDGSILELLLHQLHYIQGLRLYILGAFTP